MRDTVVLKIFRYFKKAEWMLLCLVLGFVVLQVYCDMKLPEYIEKITIVMTGTLEMKQVWMNGVYMLLCALGSACSLLVIGFCGALIGSRLSRNLREAIFDKVMEFSLADVNKFSMATLITRSTNDVTQVQMLFAMGVQFTFRAPILAVWSIIKLVGKNWQWSAITGGAVAILLCFSAFVMLFAYPRFKKIQILTDNINRIMREQLTGVRVVRAFNAEKYSQDRFGLANDELTRNNLSVNRTMITMNPIMNVIMAGMSILVFFVGAYIIQALPDAANKVSTFGQIMSVTQYNASGNGVSIAHHGVYYGAARNDCGKACNRRAYSRTGDKRPRYALRCPRRNRRSGVLRRILSLSRCAGDCTRTHQF